MGSSHSLSSWQTAPQPLLCLSQMLALWKAWPITVAGTRCTGQATQHPPSPATQWTRLARGPSRGRPSSPCREMTIPGHLCWTSARSELLGLRGGERWQGTCVGAGAGEARATVACCVASVRYTTSLSLEQAQIMWSKDNRSNARTKGKAEGCKGRSWLCDCHPSHSHAPILNKLLCDSRTQSFSEGSLSLTMWKR